MFSACFSLPISRAQRDRSFKSWTSLRSISSMRRRQSLRFMEPPHARGKSRFLAAPACAGRLGMTTGKASAQIGRSMLRPYEEASDLADGGAHSWSNLAAREAVLRGRLESADALGKSCGGGIDGFRFLDFGNESRADHGGIRQAAKN